MEYLEINKLINSFESYKEKRNLHKDLAIIDNEKKNAISDLWAKILFNATISTSIIDRDGVHKLKREFEKSKEKTVDLELIHEKYWLRYCLDEAVFPRGIRYWLHSLDEIKSNANEIEFLSYIQKTKNSDNGKLIIKKSILDDVLIKHKEVYTNFNIDEFINKHFEKNQDISEVTLISHSRFLIGRSFQILIEKIKNLKHKSTKNYFLNLKNVTDYRDIMGSIAGKLWNLYVEEYSSVDNSTLLKWLECISSISEDFWDCTEYMSRSACNNFLDIALDLISKEPDIIGWHEEPKKLVWEDNHYIPLNSSPFLEFPAHLIKSSLYMKRQWLLEFSKFNHSFPFIDSRENLRFLIHIIIKDALKNRNERFAKLLDLSKDRPFLLEYTLFCISHNYPELIPILLTHESTISLGLSIIKKVEYRKDTIDESDYLISGTKLYKKSFDLALIHIKKIENKAQYIFEILIDLMKDFYLKNQYSPADKNLKKEIENRFSYVNNTIEKDANLFENILTDFISCIHQNTKNNNSEYGYLPIPELKILFWLISVIEKKNSSHKTEQLKFVTTCIYKIYTNEINRLKVTKNGEIKAVRWFRDQEGIETLPWESFFKHLDSRKLTTLSTLHNEIEVNIPEKFEDGSKNKSYFDETVKTTAYKIRLHLYILIQGYINLKKANNHSNISLLESTLNNLISWYNLDDFKDNKINIFDTNYELSNFGNSTYDLASNIGKLLNVASSKNFIASILKNNNDVGFFARILRNTVSESDRKLILAKFDKKNIDEYLNNTFSTTEIQQLIIDLAEEKDKVSLLPEIIDFGDKHSNPNNKEWKKFSYTYKLLLAAQTGNMDDIEQIHNNNKDIINSFASNSKKEYEDIFLFYKALCAFNTKPEEGYKLYSQIIKSNGKNVTAALNRFASKIRWALQEEDSKIELLQSALIEWEEYEKSSLPDDLISVQVNSVLNKLICYYYLSKTIEFDDLWGNINNDLRYSTQLIEIRIDFLKTLGREKDLSAYISNIIDFHKDFDNNIPEEISLLIKVDEKQELKIESKIEILPIEDLKGLSDAYVQINKRETDDFIKIIKSGVINNEVFCVKHLLLPTLEKMLDQKILFRGQDGENKYTQLASMLIDEKFSFFDNWVIRTQPPGGESDKTFGEKDLVIEHQKHPITIIEALRLDGLNTLKIEDHIERFDRYDKIGLMFYVVLTYYEKKDGFNDTWEKYKNVVRNYNFDKTKLKSKGNLEELPKDWQRGNIRIAKTDHVRNEYPCTMYHIFVDFGD